MPSSGPIFLTPTLPGALTGSLNRPQATQPVPASQPCILEALQCPPPRPPLGPGSHFPAPSSTWCPAWPGPPALELQALGLPQCVSSGFMGSGPPGASGGRGLAQVMGPSSRRGQGQRGLSFDRRSQGRGSRIRGGQGETRTSAATTSPLSLRRTPQAEALPWIPRAWEARIASPAAESPALSSSLPERDVPGWP